MKELCSMEKTVIHICRYTVEILSIQEFDVSMFYEFVFCSINLGTLQFSPLACRVHGYDIKLLSDAE